MTVTVMIVVWSVVLGVCCVLSFFFSGMETGLYALNKIRLELRAESGHRAARAVQRHLREYRNLLSVLLIGNNAVNYTATSAVTALFVLAGHADSAGWYTQALVTPTLFIFCESLPKHIFQRLGERLVYQFIWLLTGASVALNAVGLAPLVRGFARVLLWLTRARDGMSQSLAHLGAQRILAEGTASGVLTHSQTVMADRVMHLGDVHLRDVMIRMSAVRSAPVSADRAALSETLRHHNFSRFPLLDEAGQVTGIVDVNDLLLGPADGPVKRRAPLTLHQDGSVTDALYQMQRAHETMAVVADPRGKHVGIVTIKDLVEEIVGDLEAW